MRVLVRMMCAVATLCLLWPAAALAQAWPARPVRLIVPFPPGGGTDLLGRIVAQELSRVWGQNVLVENRAGAGGMIGTDAVAKAAPDGYTLLHVTMAANAVAPSVYAKVPYDTERDFVYIAPLVRQPSVLVGNPKLPAADLRQLVAHLRAQKGKATYSSPGVGLSGHLGMELILKAIGAEVLHVPYKGAAAASQAMAAGETDLTLDLLPTAIPYVRGGKGRAFAITSDVRSPQLPEVPTFAEAGFPGLAVFTWQGIAAPAGTPAEIVARIERDLRALRASAEMRERLTRMGAEPFEMTATEFAAYVSAERRRWAEIARQAGATNQQ